MAILKQTGGGQIRAYDIDNVCPEGNYSARCIDLMESMGVEEEEYGKPGSFVTKDKCRFLFAVKAEDGTVHMVQSREFNISGSPKSNIVGFIRGWLGKTPPPAFDTLNLVNEVAQISISQRTSPKGTVYAAVETIAPLMDASKAPAIGEIEVPGGARAEVQVETTVTADSSSEAGKAADPF